MYEIYYYNQGIYNYQKSYSSFKDAKYFYDKDLKGYIKKGNKILKRYN